MADQSQDIHLRQGKTQPLVLRCETTPFVYKAITAILLSFGAPRLTVPGHGMPSGWRLWITRVLGMRQINSYSTDPEAGYHYVGTVIDANTIELNEVVPIDDNEKEWPAYTGGGFIQYLTPMDLTDYKVRNQIRNKKGGDTIHLSMTTENNLVAIDAANQTTTLYYDAIDLTNITWKKGYQEVEFYKDVTRGGEVIETVYSPLDGWVFADPENTK